jgi:hypothetical protein
MVSHSTIGASQIALSIQNPSQSGPRTQGDGHFRIRGVAVAISTTTAGAVSKVSLRSFHWTKVLRADRQI